MKYNIDEHIARLLNRYAADIALYGKFNWTSEHVHAEYFFKNLINLIEDCELIHTSETKLSPNTPGIDLFSDKKDFALQITARTTRLKDKVKGTIKQFDEHWKNNYSLLKILFFTDDTKELKNYSLPVNVEIQTHATIIEKIKNLDYSKKSKIYDFLLQQLTYYNDSYGNPLVYVKQFENIKSQKYVAGLSSAFYEKNNLLYFNNTDANRCTSIIDKLVQEGNKTFLIYGAPCTGKSTFIFRLSQEIEKKLKKVFYLDLLSIKRFEEAEKDLNQLLAQDCIVAIDNVNENLKLSSQILHLIQSSGLATLFIMRKTTEDEFSLGISIDDFEFAIEFKEETENYYLRTKFNGIIEYRLDYLLKEYPDIKWEVGNINEVNLNSEYNLLKLSITLFFWERFKGKLKLSEFTDERLYRAFFEEHFGRDYPDEFIERIYTYASIYKFNCPFVSKRDNIQNELIEKGFIWHVPLHNMYVFPHTEYASLIEKAIRFYKGKELNSVAKAIENYIVVNTPANINELLKNISIQNEFGIINTIFECSASFDVICSYYNLNKQYYEILNSVLFTLCKAKHNLNQIRVVDFIKSTFEDIETIRTYESQGERIIENLKNLVDFYNINDKHLSHLLDKYSIESKIQNHQNLFGLATEIKKKSRNHNVVINFLNNLTYSDWRLLFFKSSKLFGKSAESLSTLHKMPESRQLSFDLFRLINTDLACKSLNGCDIDIIGKALSDLSSFNSIDNNRKVFQIFNSLKNKGAFEKKTQNLSKYSIGVSHLKKAVKNEVLELFPSEQELEFLFNGATPNDLSQRIPELISAFPSKEESLLKFMVNILVQPKFVRDNVKDTIGFSKLLRYLKKSKIRISGKDLETITELLISNKSRSLVHRAELALTLKDYLTQQQIGTLINSRDIQNDLSNQSLNVTHLEDIIHKNAKAIRPEFAFKTLVGINSKVFIQSCTKSTVSFEQLSKIFMLLFRITSSNGNIESDYIVKCFRDYSIFRKDNLLNKSKKANLYDFLSGYWRFYKIDNIVCKELFEHQLKNRADNKDISGITFSVFTQPLRNLVELKDDETTKIANQILKNSRNVLLQSAELLDIGKISTGLKELSLVSMDLSDDFCHKLKHLIVTKIKNEKNRKDMKSRIIPELEQSCKDKELIFEFKRLANA